MLCRHKAERHTQLLIRSALRVAHLILFYYYVIFLFLLAFFHTFFFSRRSGFALFLFSSHCVRECATIVTAAILSLFAACAHECKQKTHIKCAWLTSWRLCRERDWRWKNNRKIKEQNKCIHTVGCRTKCTTANGSHFAFSKKIKTKKKRRKNGRNNNNKWELQWTAASECAQPTKCVLDASPEQDQQQLADSDTIV